MIRITTILSVVLLTAAPALGQLNQRGNFAGAMRGAIPGVHEPFSEPVTAEKISTAIDDAVMYLRAAHGNLGSGGSYQQDGYVALAALTILASGANPAADPQLKEMLDWLAQREPNNTYVRGIRANVWEYALRKVPYDKRIRELLKTDYDWLMQALGEQEGWRYNISSTDWDNSCTQYGVLGVWAAARAGFETTDAFWEKMSKHFRGCQNADGGWGYTGSGSTPNMATAGLASMFLVFDMYHGRNFYSKKNPRTFTSGDAAEVLASLDRGMDWLGKASGNKNDGYYLYGIERTGVAGGRKYIGGEDWFARGSLAVLQSQQANGSVPMGSWGGASVNTSFCTLFLVYGGAPVAIEKLQYGDGHDWNLNPRDLANLSKHLWSAYEQPLNWQTVSIDTAARDFEAPILFISGSEAAKFSEEEMLRLREYIQRGGTILAEPSDHSKAFAASMEELVRRMFPKHDYPGYDLKPLPADHGIYTVIKQDWEKRPQLRGVSDGSRTFFLLSDEYMSADWQTNRTKTDAFRLAMNLLFYTTDLGTLEGKFATILPDVPAAPKREAEISVARVRHSGPAESPRDWDSAAMSWKIFAPRAAHITGCALTEKRPVTLGKDDLEGIKVLHLTGRRRLVLAPDAREALKAFADGGGTVLVDAYAGSPEFAVSARSELETVFGKLEPLPADHLLADGRFEGGVDLSEGIRFKLPTRQLLRKEGESSEGQKLLIAKVGDRPAVIFSPFDLTAAMAGIENYRSLGYKPDSARKIVSNILAYVMVD
ncbi:MAG: DUF4159 domain-containing protein [Planctomycetes bacterium]|nr:DUF4159 domain-containing protein [Planctomycetota bacterium]